MIDTSADREQLKRVFTRGSSLVSFQITTVWRSRMSVRLARDQRGICVDQVAGSADANEAVEISILQQGADTPRILSTFHPKFTYPIFGEEERIFGYQGLHVNLRFAAHDLQPNVEINYEKKFKTIGETKAADIEDTLREWLPPCTYASLLYVFVVANKIQLQRLSTRPPNSMHTFKVTHPPRTFDHRASKSSLTGVKEEISRYGAAI